jgi:hypothetical protein
MRNSTNPFEGFGNIDENIKDIIEDKFKEESEFIEKFEGENKLNIPEDFYEDRDNNNKINFDENMSYGNEYKDNLKNNFDVDFDFNMDSNLNSNIKLSTNDFQTEQKNLGIDIKIMRQFNKKNKKIKFNELVKKIENEYDPSEIFYRILSLAQTNKLNVQQNELFNNDEIIIKNI